MNKLNAFAYLMTLYTEWYQDIAKKDPKEGLKKNAFSQLLSLKLLFLTATTREKDDDPNTDLLDIFNDFVAMPYGPVESEIYNAIKNRGENKIPGIVFDYTTTSIDFDLVNQLNDIDREKLQLHVNKLRDLNSELIIMNPFHLVDLTHRWSSWITNYEFAQWIGRSSYKMDKEEIRKDVTSGLYKK